MEINKAQLNFVGLQNGNLLSTVRQKQSSIVTPILQSLQNEGGYHTRKNKLQLQELMRKKAIQKRIQERDKAAQQRLQHMKSQKQMSATLNKKKSKNFSQEKVFYPPKIKNDSVDLKNVQTQSLFKNQWQTQKQNTIKIYQNATKTNQLPKIKKQRIEHKEDSICPKNEEISLVDFGIFTQRKKMNIFTKKLKSSLQKQFIGGIDLHNPGDLERLQSLILAEMGSEQRWLITQ